MPTFATNKKARHDYELLDTFEAGLVLTGHEVKAIKTGQLSLRGAFVTMRGKEVMLTNATISPYQPKNTPDDYDPTRPRKLLLNKREVNALLGKLKQKGLTLVPVRVYTRGSRLKLGFALCKGKKKHDKRQQLKKREFKRDRDRLLRGLL